MYDTNIVFIFIIKKQSEFNFDIVCVSLEHIITLTCWHIILQNSNDVVFIIF